MMLQNPPKKQKFHFGTEVLKHLGFSPAKLQSFTGCSWRMNSPICCCLWTKRGAEYEGIEEEDVSGTKITKRSVSCMCSSLSLLPRKLIHTPMNSKEVGENFILVQKWVESGFLSRNEAFLSWLPRGDDLLVDCTGEWLQWRKSKRGETQEICQLLNQWCMTCLSAASRFLDQYTKALVQYLIKEKIMWNFMGIYRIFLLKEECCKATAIRCTGNVTLPQLQLLCSTSLCGWQGRQFYWHIKFDWFFFFKFRSSSLRWLLLQKLWAKMTPPH